MNDGVNEWRSLDSVRAMMADPERSHRGEATMSVETMESVDTIEDLVTQNPGAFFRLIAPLPARERDAMISYFILRQGQTHISTALSTSQTVVSFAIAKALRRIKGTPTGKRKWLRRKPVPREVIRRSDPETLGQFRVDVKDVEQVLRCVNVRGGLVVKD